MFEALSAMKSSAIVESSYNGYHYVSTHIMKLYSYCLLIFFIPMFLVEGVIFYVYMQKYRFGFMKSMYISFFANLISAFVSFFLIIIEAMMNELHFSSMFSAVYLIIISFVLTFMVETAIIYHFVKNDLPHKDALNTAGIISFCMNLVSHIVLSIFLALL